MKQLIDKIMQHFEDYVEKRRCLDLLFALLGATHSRLSIMGCSYFSLVYVLCGSEIDSRLQELLQGSVKFVTLVCLYARLDRKFIVESGNMLF